MLEVSHPNNYGRLPVLTMHQGGGPRAGSFHASKSFFGLGVDRKTHASDYTEHGFPLGFKPAGFNGTGLNTTLQISRTDSAHFGIPGSGGVFVAFLYGL
jgi:hypothetical protein